MNNRQVIAKKPLTDLYEMNSYIHTQSNLWNRTTEGTHSVLYIIKLN